VVVGGAQKATVASHEYSNVHTGDRDPESRREKKKGRTTQRVRLTRNTGRRAQPKACARQGSTTERLLHPETRHAAHEKVGTKKKGAHNPKGASNSGHGAARTTKGVRTTGEYDPEGCFTQQPDTPHERKLALSKKGRTTPRVRRTRNTGRRAQPKAKGSTTERVLHPETRHAAHEKVGTKKKGAHNPTGASNPEHGAARTTKGVRPKGVHDVSHPEIRHTRALREHSPGACVTSGTGRSARRTAVAVCRRPHEGDAFEQDRPSTCAQTGMSVVPSRLGRSGSLVRS